MRRLRLKRVWRVGSELSNGAKPGADDEIRTRDIQLGKLTLYQLSYIRARPERTPTAGPMVAHLRRTAKPVSAS